MASLAEWLSVHLQTKWLWVRIHLYKCNIYILRSLIFFLMSLYCLLIAESILTQYCSILHLISHISLMMVISILILVRTPSQSQKGPKILICLSFHPSFQPAIVLSDIGPLVFLSSVWC